MKNYVTIAQHIRCNDVVNGCVENKKNMKIVADNKIPFLKGVLEPFVDVCYKAGNEISRSDLLDADALIVRTRTKCNKNLLEGTKVKFIASATIGFDHIDSVYCKNNGIQWVNSAGCNASSVSQWFLAALLAYANKKKVNLKNRTLGVIGVGHVGSKIVAAAEALGMRVLLNDPPREHNEGSCEFVSLKLLLQESDILSLHVPLYKTGQDKTYHLVNEEFLNNVNPGTLLINSSRGEVIDTSALISALDEQLVSDVILDVWENEPDIERKLLEKAFIGTPHIAGYSFEGKATGTSMVVRAISNYFDLPLSDWEPDELLNFELVEVNLDTRQKSFEEICLEAIAKTYLIFEDDKRLRTNPEKFEWLRGNYIVRHEPRCYMVKINDDQYNFKYRLKQLGFQ